jgi:hypothetical protein
MLRQRLAGCAEREEADPFGHRLFTGPTDIDRNGSRGHRPAGARRASNGIAAEATVNRRTDQRLPPTE